MSRRRCCAASNKKPDATAAGTDAEPRPATDVQAALTVLGRLPQRPNVSRGDLTGAQVAGAQLGGADLSSAQLGRANLTGAKLQGADLRKTIGLTQEQLNAAHGDAETQLPDGLQRPDGWQP